MRLTGADHWDDVKGMAVGSYIIPSTSGVKTTWKIKPLRPGDGRLLGFSIVGIIDSRVTGIELSRTFKKYYGTFSPAVSADLRYYGNEWTGKVKSHHTSWSSTFSGVTFNYYNQNDVIGIELDLLDPNNPKLTFLDKSGWFPRATFTHIETGQDIEYKLWVGCSNEGSGFQIVEFTQTTQ